MTTGDSAPLPGDAATTPAGDEATPDAGRSLPAPPSTLSDLASRAQREVGVLDRELAEIDMLVQQARSEATRHETKRAQAAEKLATLSGGRGGDPKEIAELGSQLASLARRAAIMDAQVEVLTGKQQVLARYRDALGRHADALSASMDAGTAVDVPASTVGVEGAGPQAGTGQTGGIDTLTPGAIGATPDLPPALSRIVLGAQEDLRREIARALHDGPAQSLTNIVLQAQIVERLMTRDLELARNEVLQLITMVQSTLEATKSFIFDVRPMVLDDLGLVPTIRRAARDRGRRARVPVDFDSVGADRRLPVDLESGLFRIVEEALAGFLSGQPDRVTIRLDWAERLDARIAAVRPAVEAPAEPVELPKRGRGRGGRGPKGAKEAVELPPALAAMIEDRRAAEVARAKGAATLSAGAWREIQQRAATIGVSAELLADGTEVHLTVLVPDEPA
ncbi:MAG TPA: histidine kinase [Candidatus Limnocylindrales bacterium]